MHLLGTDKLGRKVASLAYENLQSGFKRPKRYWYPDFTGLNRCSLQRRDLRLRKESVMTGWSTASFDNGDWLSVEELPPLTAALVPSDGPPVRKLKKLQPKEIFQTVSGKVIVDFGQNFAGCARIIVSGPSGTDIILRNAEVLENGEIETKPPRTTDVPARKFENLDLHFTASAMLRLTTGP
ncbi:hypothetical protein FOXB_06383 [Fusarium oxysporum f. sp. conglutinans Fo5176]|uniref:Alpha-L-rhamnosidase concanavalin-like domain-containing protein n=2 Tax=Fusarium oxysporum f. sp. conglutinans TaxID=100902 RepID=F9FJ04_FUSOF|nr:hypothetical protein FOXB_06383 [Fusarium oxysporum f. sp. conglutinans Fo5176]